MTNIGFVDSKNNKAKLTKEIATRQKYVDYFTYFDILPDPDPILEERGDLFEVYKKLLQDPQVWTCYQSRKSGTLSKNWSIDRGKAETKKTKIIEELFNNLDINKIITDILDAPFFGISVLEVIWKRQNNLILPQKLIAKPPEWFGFDDNNILVLKSKTLTPDYLPPRKFLLAQHNAGYLNPYGTRILSKCYWPVSTKKGGLQFWLMFTERYGMPFLTGKLRDGMNQDEIDNFVDALGNLIQDAVITIPEGTDIQMMEAGGKGASADIYQKLLEHCDESISKAILGQTLTTDIGSTGSYAASKTHFEVRQDIIETDTRLVEKTFNRLIKWIDELNWYSGNTPEFSMWEEEDVDKDLAERDKILADTGIKFTKKYYMKTYGFDEEDIELLQPESNESQEFAAPEFKDQKIVDNFIDSFVDSELEAKFKNILNPVLELFKQDPNKALEKLAQIYPDMNSKQLEDTLTNIIFVSETWGRLSREAD